MWPHNPRLLRLPKPGRNQYGYNYGGGRGGGDYNRSACDTSPPPSYMSKLWGINGR